MLASFGDAVYCFRIPQTIDEVCLMPRRSKGVTCFGQDFFHLYIGQRLPYWRRLRARIPLRYSV